MESLRSCLLILSTFISLLAVCAAFRSKKNPAMLKLEKAKIVWNMKSLIAVLFRLLFPKRGVFRKLFSVCIVAVFAGASFWMLQQFFLPWWIAAILCVLITLLCLVVFYVSLIALSKLLWSLLNCGNHKITLFLSFAALQLVLLFVSEYKNFALLQNEAGFWLMAGNLLFCYSILVRGLLLILRESVRQTTEVTFKNIWKFACLEILFFLLTLTMLSYAAWLHLPSVYQTADGRFGFGAAFYHVVVTFGTVGYGDIVPVSWFTRAVSVLTVFTSIGCLTIMISSVMSLSRKAAKGNSTSSEE